MVSGIELIEFLRTDIESLAGVHAVRMVFSVTRVVQLAKVVRMAGTSLQRELLLITASGADAAMVCIW